VPVLRVRAGLGTGSCPAGAGVSDEQLAAPPITRHSWHGDWNYTLRPQPAAGPGKPGSPPGRGQASGRDRETLADPALTGLSRQAPGDLIAALAGPWSTQREQALRQRRGGDRRRAAGAGARPRLDLAGRVLATLLHLRLSLPQPVIARLFGADRTTITRAIGVTRQLLAQHGITIEPAPARLYTLADLTAYAAAHGITQEPEIKPAC